MNTFAVMKSGFKSVDSTGSNGPISSQKAQKLIDDYMSAVRRVARPDEVDGEHEHMEGEGDVEEKSQQVHEQELNGKVLYDLSGGTPHGRFTIANGAIRAADIRAAAKENNIRPSNSVSMQSMAREVAHLRQENTRLRHEKDSAQLQGKVAVDLIVRLYRRLGEEIPEESLSILLAGQATNGSTQCTSEEWPHADSFVAVDFSCTESCNTEIPMFTCGKVDVRTVSVWKNREQLVCYANEKHSFLLAEHSFYKLNELIHMQQVTGSSHVGSESTNDYVAADEGLHDGSRVALENRNCRNHAICGGAGAGLIQG